MSTQATPLIDAIDAAHPETMSLAAAIADVRALEAHVNERYAYKTFYEERLHFDFADVVASKIAELTALADKDGAVKVYDFTAIVASVLGVFEDFHHRVNVHASTGLVRDPNLTLGLKLFYDAGSDGYLIYGSNPEVDAQLGKALGHAVDADAIADEQLMLTKVNGMPIADLVAAMGEVLPYTNPVTKKTYGGLHLGASKGLVELAHLMKRGVLPEWSTDFALELTSRKTGQSFVVHDHAQPLGSWTRDDDLVAVEGRPKPADGSAPGPQNDPDVIAKQCGLSFDYDEGAGIAYFRLPSWAADAAGAPEAREAFYVWVTRQLEKIPRGRGVDVVFDTRGNRGGDPILWRAFVEATLDREAAVTGVIQLGRELAAEYPSAKGISEAEIFVHNGDYMNYAFAPGDPAAPPAVQKVIADADAKLRGAGRVKNGKLIDHPYFGDVLYPALQRNPRIPPLDGHVYVIQDRFGFSANDGFIGSLRAARDPSRITFIGEPSECGSGSGAGYTLPNSKLTIIDSGFVSADADGRLYERDINVPDVAVAPPLEHFRRRDAWWRQWMTARIDADRAARRSMPERQ